MKSLPASRYILTAAIWLVVVGITARGAGTTVTHVIESSAVADNRMDIASRRPVFVYLPDGYADTRRSYPVLYWIPGWSTPASREYVGALDQHIIYGMPPAIVVSIDVREGIVLLNSSVFGRWEDFVVEELVPFIDTQYRTIPAPTGRAVMGHSTGGYSALMLALRHEGVWSAVGVNDASVWAACSPPFAGFPTHLDDYDKLSGEMKVWVQLAAAISPDPHSPSGFRLPAADDNEDVVEQAWLPYCLQSLEGLSTHSDALAALAGVAIVVADDGFTNRPYNASMWEQMRRLGATGRLVGMPGSHGANRTTRFTFLADNVIARLDFRPGFPDAHAGALTWGALKADASERHQ